MANPGSDDANQNNMGITIGGTTDYGTWDWRKIKVAITGSVNTDSGTAQNKLTGTSSPQSFYDAAHAFDVTHTNLLDLHTNLKSWKDFLVGTVNPAWTGQAADAFRQILERTLTSVKGHLDPLTGPPTYYASLVTAGNALFKAVGDMGDKDAAFAQQVIDTYNANPDGDPPWYDYRGTTIVMISHYPDIDHEFTRQAQGVLHDLVHNYKSTVTSMPSPPALPVPNPGAGGNGGPQEIKIPPIKFKDPPKTKEPKAPKEPPPPDPKDLATDGPAGPDGQPLGPDGKPLGAGDVPQAGPDGPAGPDGQPTDAVKNGLNSPNLVNTPQGPAVVGPDGTTLLDPKTGKPLKGPDGRPLTLGDLASSRPPGGTRGTRTPPELTEPKLRPPGSRPLNLTSGGPPPRSAAELRSEGALKPGAKEFGAKEGAATEAAAAGRGGGRGGEPMPMGGGMGGAGANGERERERTTWLVEDEEIWGAETAHGAGVLGR
jgi:hypothetical protein